MEKVTVLMPVQIPVECLPAVMYILQQKGGIPSIMHNLSGTGPQILTDVKAAIQGAAMLENGMILILEPVRRVFIEHVVVIRDLDNGDQLPGTTMLWDGVENVEEVACNAVKSDTAHIFGSNTIEAEYRGTSGRTAIGEFGMKKYAWKLIKELTASKIDLNQLVRHA